MARINTYITDADIVALDKWVGTDFSNGFTKNFTAQGVADYLNKANAVGIIGQCNFLFQDDILPGRLSGSMSFQSGHGIGTAFSAITTIKFSKYASNTNLVLDYLENLIGAQIILAQVDNINNFGIYTLNSLTQDVVEPNFYDASFTLVSSNGILVEDKYYGIAAYGTGSGGGGTNNTVTSYRSDAVGLTIYAGYLLNGNPVITKYVEGVLTTAEGVTDLETDWTNRLTLTYS